MAVSTDFGGTNRTKFNAYISFHSFDYIYILNEYLTTISLVAGTISESEFAIRLTKYVRREPCLEIKNIVACPGLGTRLCRLGCSNVLQKCSRAEIDCIFSKFSFQRIRFQSYY